LDEFGSLPVHPLLVHLPVVLLPLAAVGAVLLMLRPSWYLRYRWLAVIICGIGTVGAVLAAQSGEELEGEIRSDEGAAAVRGIGDHAEAGEMARNLALLFFVCLLVYALIPWWTERRRKQAETAGSSGTSQPGWLRPVAMALVVLTAALTSAAVFRAGHSGAEQVWEESEDGEESSDVDDDEADEDEDEDSIGSLVDSQVVVTLAGPEATT
jgi:uncharacterized membrane protein